MANSPFPPQTFPDGFPTQPEEAVMAAYFLTPEEREEWLAWLPTTTEDKKQELVSTLHEIFVQNQKNVLPQGFTAPPMGNNQGAPYNPNQNNQQNNFQNPPQNAPYNPNQNSGFQQQYQPQQQPQNAGYNPQNSQPNPNFGQDFPVPASPQQPSLPPSPSFAPDNNFGNYNFQETPEPQVSPYSSSYEQELKEFNSQNPTPAFNAPAPESRFEPAENPYAQNSFQAPVSQPAAAVPIPVRSNAQLQPQDDEDEEEEFSFEEPKNESPYSSRPSKEPSEESFLNLTKTQYTSSPILNKDQYENELVFADEEEEEEKPAPKAPERKASAPEREVREDFPPAFAPENKAAGKLEVDEPKPKANANFSSFNASKDLEKVYNLYLENQQKSANLEKEYQRRQQEQAESQQAFLNKVLNMLSDFEVMKEKELDKTRVMSDLSGKVQKLMNVTDVRGSSSLQSQINRLESKLNRAVSDMEILSRDLNDFKNEVYEKISEISEKVAEKEGDVYGAGGINQKLDLLTAKIARLESQNKLNSLSSSLNSSGE